MLRALLVVAPLALSSAIHPQEEHEPLCGVCKTTGRVAHERLQKELEPEVDTLYCTEFMEGDPALGLDWIPCPDCKAPSKKAAAEREWNGLMQIRRNWLEERRKIDALVGRDLMHCQSRHFVLAFDLPSIKVDRVVLRQHEAMHVYLKRCEDLYAEILRMMGIDESAMLSTLFQVHMFESLKSAKTAAPHLTGMNMGGDAKVSLIGPIRSSLVSWDDPQKVQDDDNYRYQFLVHSLSHHIHHSVRDYNFWLFKDYGWVYEGLAYYHEITMFGPPITHCSQETGGSDHQWQGKCWEANIKKAVLANKQPNFQDVISKGADQLSSMERQFAWSYIDYLMWENPNQMDELLDLMKDAQLPARDALKQAYNLSVGQFIDNWTEFVRTEYSSKPFKGAKARTPRVPPGGEAADR